jgi:membrane dipeptidase
MSPASPQGNISARFGERATITDMVFVYEPPIGNDHALFQLYIDAGFNFIQCHPAGDDHNISQAVQRIAQMRRDISVLHDKCVLVETIDDIARAKIDGKLAVGIQLEGFRCLERNLNMIDAYYALGVRLCHPIFNITNSIGGGCADGSELGLTRFGHRVIERMNEVGMIVDGAHAGRRAQLDMLERSTTPVVFSHHGVAGIYPHIRNITDEAILGCAARNGVVGITGAGYYLGGTPTPELFFRHLDYVVQMVGPDHVGLGLDWTADTERLKQAFIAAPDIWGALDQWQPMEFYPPNALTPLIALMDDAGYPEEAILGIIGGNWMRVAADTWKT